MARTPRDGGRTTGRQRALRAQWMGGLACPGAGLDVPCDAQGRVRLDGLGERLRNDYFFARTLVGRLFATPTVRLSPPLARS